jgi:hypothetical protein
MLASISTAIAYSDPTKIANLPYSSNFNFKRSVFTAYSFDLAKSSISITLTNLKLSINRDATLKANSYYYGSSGSWILKDTDSVAFNGTASNRYMTLNTVAGRIHCVRFSKTDYTDYLASAVFTIE